MLVLHKFRVLNKMAAMSHGSVVMQQVFCALCAAQLNQSTSRINVLGRSLFPVENEVRKLQLNVLIDEHTRICISCLRKLKKKKALEENLTAISDEIVRTFRGSYRPIDFVPSSVTCSTPTKAGQPTTGTCLDLPTPRTLWSPFETPTTSMQSLQSKQIEPGVWVSCSPLYCSLT